MRADDSTETIPQRNNDEIQRRKSEWQKVMQKTTEATEFKNEYKIAVGAARKRMIVEIESISERMEIDHSSDLGVGIKRLKELQDEKMR